MPRPAPVHRHAAPSAGLLAALAWALLLAPAAGARELFAPVMPAPFGVNIHFVNPNDAEMDKLADAGFRIIRVDFTWSSIERTKGKYRFDDYDRLHDACQKRGIRCLFIFDYSNKLYDEGLSPHTDAGRAAFAAYAAASAKHFAGKDVFWEIWNEPNISQFWKPKPSADDYASLSLAVIDAVRAADPDAFIIGPGTSEFPWAYFQVLAARGVLAKLDAVSVHPYRLKDPESAEADFARLRTIVDQASPGKHLPLIASEWGFSTGYRGIDEATQARYLVRQRLANLASDVGFTIWYDWKDDGDNPKEPEHHFGALRRDLLDKPATLASRKCVQVLDGMAYVRRLAIGNEANDYLLLFQREGRFTIAHWTRGEAHDVELPGVGEGGKAITLHLAPDVDYFAIDKPSPELMADLSWKPVTQLVSVLAVAAAGDHGPSAELQISAAAAEGQPANAQFRLRAGGKTLGSATQNLVAGKPQTVSIPIEFADRDKLDVPAVVDRVGGGALAAARVRLAIRNPLSAQLLPPVNGTLRVLVANPSGAAVNGELRINSPLDADLQSKRPFSMDEEQTAAQFDIAVGALDAPAAGIIADDLHGGVLFSTPALRFVPIPIRREDAWRVVVDGAANVKGQADLETVTIVDSPRPGIDTALRINYRFEKGWKFASVFPPKALGAIEGKPRALGMWVNGDASGNALRLRIADATGQRLQPTYGPCDFTGWRWITFPLTGTDNHYGGANDGLFHHPLSFDSALVIDSAQKRVGDDTHIDIAGLALIYEVPPK